MAELTIESRLEALGDSLVFPAADSLAADVLGALDGLGFPDADSLAADVLAARDAPGTLRSPWPRRLLVAAALVIVLAGVAAVPTSRRAVARWFGFDDYRIDRVVELPDVTELGTGTRPAGVVLGPGELVATYDVDGVTVVVMDLPGGLDVGLFRKLVDGGTIVTATEVAGAPAYWIEGRHVLMYLEGGKVREARLSSNALVWERDGGVRRVEGDITLAQALALAGRVL